MIRERHLRAWQLVAVIAILAALVLLMVPQVHSGYAGAWLAVLPILFVGLVSPLTLLSPLAYIYLGRVPDSPVLPTSFQRPPPSRLA